MFTPFLPLLQPADYDYDVTDHVSPVSPSYACSIGFAKFCSSSARSASRLYQDQESLYSRSFQTSFDLSLLDAMVGAIGFTFSAVLRQYHRAVLYIPPLPSLMWFHPLPAVGHARNVQRTCRSARSSNSDTLRPRYRCSSCQMVQVGFLRLQSMVGSTGDG